MSSDNAMQEVVLITGGTGATGLALSELLLAQGLRVAVASRTGAFSPELAERADALSGPAFSIHAADLTREADVEALRAHLQSSRLRIAQIVHLVGGWAGGRGIAGQSDEKYRLLAASFDALRTVSRSCYPDLLGAERPRIISVSSPLAQDPTASGANYAAVKAATEAWTRSLNAGLVAETEAGAASIIVTDSLQGRESGFAELVAKILAAPRSRVAGRRITHV